MKQLSLTETWKQGQEAKSSLNNSNKDDAGVRGTYRKLKGKRCKQT